MHFGTLNDLNTLEKEARRAGAVIREGKHSIACQMLQEHEYFMIAAADGRMKAEAVTLTREGDFICVMIDTDQPEPVSLARQNFNSFPDTDISHVCDTLETVRRAYFGQLENRRVAA